MKPDAQFDFAAVCPGLQHGVDGILYASASEAISYPEEGNEACFEVEDLSFWFRHRNDCIIELVRNFPPELRGPIFDVGGGNGFVAKGLIDAGWDVVLVEPGPSGARNAKSRGVNNVICGMTQSAEFKNGSLPAIGVFDVVEHIKNDIGFLCHLRDLLEPGGMLYLTVPAYNFLWSHEDVDAGHFRRYTLGALEKKLCEVGLETVFGTYIFGFLPLPVFLLRTIPYRLGLVRKGSAVKAAKREHAQKQGLIGALMGSIFESELNRIRSGKYSVFGGSCLVASRKQV